jgi:hypothetical protein
VVVTGVFVANFDDLTTVIRAAIGAREMRALGLMTLTALDARDRVQFPVCRTTTARLTARRLPF